MTRQPGEGSLFQRESDGMWIGQVIVGHKPNGRPVYRTVSSRDPGVALVKFQELQRQAGAGVVVSPAATVRELLESYQAHKEATLRSARSIESIAGAIRRDLIPHLGHVRLAKLTPAQVERMLVAIGRTGGHPRTALIARSVLRAAWNWARRQRWVSGDNPAADADPGLVAYRPKPHTALTPEQVRVVMAAEHPLRSLWIVALASGMRVSELVALTWEDVDLERGVVGVPGTKTPLSDAPILLPAYAVAALRAHRVECAGFRGLVWRTRVGTAYDRRNVSRWWTKHLADLGLPHVTLHEAARHTYAMIGREQGVPVSAVQAVLRHSQMATTSDIYGAGRSLAEQRLAVEALEKLFGAL